MHPILGTYPDQFIYESSPPSQTSIKLEVCNRCLIKYLEKQPLAKNCKNSKRSAYTPFAKAHFPQCEQVLKTVRVQILCFIQHNFELVQDQQSFIQFKTSNKSTPDSFSNSTLYISLHKSSYERESKHTLLLDNKYSP